MASVCLCFHLHLPYQLKRFSVFDTEPVYFDEARTEHVCRRMVEVCYLPATRRILELVRQHDGAFKLCYSISGLLLEQLEKWAPQVVDLLRELTATGCVEWLAETYHHSLACLYSQKEFEYQVAAHRRRIASLFDQQPTVFRNTELIYSNEVAAWVGKLGFAGLLCGGAGLAATGRCPSALYDSPADAPVKILVQNTELTAQRFEQRVARAGGTHGCMNLFLDYEMLAEPRRIDVGIPAFFSRLSEAILAGGHVFETASEMIASRTAQGTYDVPQATGRADPHENSPDWLTNSMQRNALDELYTLESAMDESADDERIWDWRRLQSSDHIRAMSTAKSAPAGHGPPHEWDSPYDAYISFMNALNHLATRPRSSQPGFPC